MLTVCHLPLISVHGGVQTAMFICLSVCLFVCLSVCLFVCLSVCLFVCLSVCLFVCCVPSLLSLFNDCSVVTVCLKRSVST